MCGNQIIRNLLKRSGYKLSYPEMTDGTCNFKYNGIGFIMKEVEIDLNDNE